MPIVSTILTFTPYFSSFSYSNRDTPCIDTHVVVFIQTSYHGFLWKSEELSNHELLIFINFLINVFHRERTLVAVSNKE